uniref:C2H2-type domain-containing protein n=1 Tax=Cacopsylla melanoneura TaxID=428564 RepID=A0A8D8Z9C9_9HEMI
MKIIIYALMLLIICTHCLSMTSMRKNRTLVRVRKTTTMSQILVNTTQIVENKTTKARRIKVKVKKNSTKLLRSLLTIPDLDESHCTAMHHLPNTRLNEVVLRTPFILSFDQREELTRVVKKLWWNCRLLARFIREEKKITTTQSSHEKLKVKQYRELLKPVMDEELYYCDQCTKSFGQFLGIWNHMRSRHKIEVKPTRKIQGQVRGTYNLKRRYTTLKDYYEAHEDQKKK